MTKKLILLGALMAMLAACSSEDDSAKSDEKVEPVAAEEVEETEEETGYYELTVPAEFAYDVGEDEEVTSLFEEITTNDDGSITYIMEENLHGDFMKELEKQFDVEIQNIVDTYPGYNEIRYSDAYDAFEVDVDPVTFEEESGTEALYVLMVLTGMYNAFAGYAPEDITFTFDFFNEETGEAITSITYPDNAE